MAFITPEFLLTSLIVVIAPGTGTLYTIATGLAAGRGMSFAAAFGCTRQRTPLHRRRRT